MSELMFNPQNWPQVTAAWPEGRSDLFFAGWRKAVDGAQKAVLTVALDVKALRSSGNLTERGIREAAGAAVDKTLTPALRTLHAALREIAERLPIIRAEAVQAALKADAGDGAVRAEIRAHMRRLDPVKRMEFLRDEGGAALVTAAILAAPGF